MADKSPKLTKYILKNITNYDVNLGDLRYSIPAKRSRDLLAKNARLLYNDIMKSKESGSIHKKLGRSLIEVGEIKVEKPPVKTLADPSAPVVFPQRTKSLIVIDVGEITEEMQESVLNEEDEFLKQLELSYEGNSTPIVAIRDDDEEIKED